ncbi:MAG: hypothetical protein AUI10_00445 [Actinobacteria bacterium 13_2_20CM_2_72_6]|nr:MAG: hypothetical protein AUI10_00445 [Actinobacteria bacterium 13_2_20CM_2_72_6]OLE28884.1 MAG: hypothetical protein AUG44_06185 [Actinobacteria bacterium 13_1_20CM_3_71_11]
MTDGSDIVYDFNGINTLSGQVATFVSQMNEHLDEVDRIFKGLLADGWSGQAATAFQDCSTRWHGGATQMAMTLQGLSQKVGNAAVNMQQADQQAAARF